MSARVAPILHAAPLAVLLALGGTSVGTSLPASGDVTPHQARTAAAAPDPADFTHGRVTNEWFPLKPGTKTVFTGIKDGGRTRNVVVVLRQTRTIQGVVCRAVWDRLYLGGVLHERTIDWYAQHRNGDVWYFGERTAELDVHGNVVTREGSWLAGRDGARAGILMTATPRVGQTHQQEYYAGHAEDRFRVIDIAGSVTVPLLNSGSAVVTAEWTPLEPNVLDHKYYVRDLGQVLETSIRGPREVNRLVSVEHVG